MATLTVSVQPLHELKKEEHAKARSRLVVHYQEIVVRDENDDITSREASLSFDISPEFVGQTEIIEYAPGTSINLSLISSTGMLILSENVNSDDLDVGGTEDAFVYVWKLTKEEMKTVKDQIDRKPLYPSILNRQGQFISIGFPSPEFSKYKLMISPIRKTEISPDALANIFDIDSFGTVSKRLRFDKLTELARLPLGELISTKIGISGQFEFSVPVDGDEAGWIWLLNGPIAFIGIQEEDNQLEDSLYLAATRRSILLPPPSLDDPDEEETIASEIVIGGADSCSSSNDGRHSLDVSEDELLSNPDVFNDAPGAFCRPFSNPNRVVSERTFHTILRVEQPTVGSKPYVPPYAPPLAPPPDAAVVLGSSTTGGRIMSLATYDNNLTATNVTRDVNSAASNSDEYKSQIKTFARKVPRGRFVLNANTPLNWEGDSTEYQATSLGFGHVLESRVQWRNNGVSLGPMASSLTLAPRQTKRIVTIQSKIVDKSRRDEATDFRESVDTGTDREYSYQNQVESHLKEWSRGGSVAGQMGGALGFGGFISGVLFGGGGAHGLGASGSTQKGGRDIASQENQNLRDSIRTYGDSLRQLDSMVVIDQSQEEFVQGVSETVRNINYCHSLTIIYHEILRHLRVDTRIVGARECVFVPFEIKPFTLTRILKWRDTLSRVLRRRRLRWVIRYLPDKLSNFVGSSIPNRKRSEIPINHVTGSVYIQLKIERPKDDDDGSFIEDNWESLLSFAFDPIFGIFSFISTLSDEKKDVGFQKKYAAGIATNWADSLSLWSKGNQEIKDADFTLVSSYHYGRTVRVDFSFTHDSGELKREDLVELTVKAPDLPEGSIANVKQIRFHYYTDHFDHQVSSPRGTNDLIVVKTGKSKQTGARVYLPTTRWEEVNLRNEINKAADELTAHLDEYTEYYHKMIWWRLDRDKLYMMLDGIKLSPEDERSVASVVERNPIAVVGNALVYRVATGAFIGVDGHQDADSLNYHYRDTNTHAEPLRISLPTSGLYAQSLMDKCESCEEHFGSTDWVLTNGEPELAELGPQLLASRRAQSPDTTPTDFPDSIVNIQNAATPPSPSGFTDTLNAVTNANAFRDMAGLAGTQANARAAMETAAELAAKFGSEAAALYKAQMSASNAKNKMSAIDKAHKEGSIDDEEKKKQTKIVIDEMNQGTNTEEKFATAKQQLDMIGQLEKQGGIASQNAEIARKRVIESLTTQLSGTNDTSSEDLGKLIEKASIFGADVKKGVNSFEIKTDSKTNPKIIDVNVTPKLRAFGSNSDFTGKTKLSVRGKNLPLGTELRWSIPPTETGKYSITQRTTSSGVSEVEISGIQPGLSAIDVEAIDRGTKIASEKHSLSIPQFVTIADNNVHFGDFISNNNFQAIQDAILEEARAVINLLLLSEANVRLLWASQGDSVPAHILANFVTTVIIGNEAPSGDEAYAISSPNSVTGGGVGDTSFNEEVSIFPASYLAQNPSSSDVNTAANDLVNIITGIQSSDPDLESWVIRFFGRMLGETISHELFHTLLPVAFVHNEDAVGNVVDTGDIMDDGSQRTFLQRTGIVALSTLPADFLDNLTDTTRGAINKLTNAVNLAHIHAHFPIPPTPPFDK